MRCVGIHLPKRYVTAAALDSTGQVVAAERWLGTTAEVELGWLHQLGEPAAVAAPLRAAVIRSGERRVNPSSLCLLRTALSLLAVRGGAWIDT